MTPRTLGGTDFEIIPTNNICLLTTCEQAHFVSPHVLAAATLLLPWQASPTGNVGSEAANPVVSRPGRLCTSEIPKLLSVSLVMTPPRHHLPALPPRLASLGKTGTHFGRGY